MLAAFRAANSRKEDLEDKMFGTKKALGEFAGLAGEYVFGRWFGHEMPDPMTTRRGDGGIDFTAGSGRTIDVKTTIGTHRRLVVRDEGKGPRFSADVLVLGWSRANAIWLVGSIGAERFRREAKRERHEDGDRCEGWVVPWETLTQLELREDVLIRHSQDLREVLAKHAGVAKLAIEADPVLLLEARLIEKEAGVDLGLEGMPES
jgi:hypothetical protein